MHEQASIPEVDATSSQYGQDDAAALNDEDRSTSHSRSTSAPLNGEALTQNVSVNGTQKPNGRGKGKERESVSKVSEGNCNGMVYDAGVSSGHLNIADDRLWVDRYEPQTEVPVISVLRNLYL